MTPHDHHLRSLTRRHFFRQSTAFGIGSLALASLFNDHSLTAAPNSSLSIHHSSFLHLAPKAKSIIYLFMAGAPSQLDLFDPKPKLTQFNGQPIPSDIVKGERFAFIKGTPKLLASPYTEQFKRCGQSGQLISPLLPHLQSVADDIAIVRSLSTTQFNHAH
jgi:hypothetical protein